jgi:hypothetical protein
MGHVTCIRQVGNLCRIVIENPEWKRPLRRPKRSWEDNIKIELEKLVCEVVN